MLNMHTDFVPKRSVIMYYWFMHTDNYMIKAMLAAIPKDSGISHFLLFAVKQNRILCIYKLTTDSNASLNTNDKKAFLRVSCVRHRR